MTAPSADELLAHADWLHQLARALVGEDAAGDVVQETYAAAIAKPPGREGPLRPWLGGVARNLAKMSLRGRRRREDREVASAVTIEAPTSEVLVERARMYQKVAAIVLELPDTLRDVLLLRFFEGLSAAEIARAQGVPGATVRSRLVDALERVRAALDTEHQGDRRAWAVVLAPLPFAGGASPAVVVTGGIIVKLKVTIGLVLVALAALLGTRALGWWGASTTAPPSPPLVAAGSNAGPVVTPPRPAAQANASRLPAVAHDDDPQGTLRLEGQVIDGSDKPVGGAQVAIDANPTKTVVSEPDGSFVFEGLIARDYQLEATAHSGDQAGYAQARLRLAPDHEPVTLRIARAGTVEVVVTDATRGTPVAGAAVELRSTLVWSATSDANGVATLHGVGPTWSPLTARAVGYAQAGMMLNTSGDPEAPARVALALATGAALIGKVIDGAGKPVAGARVVATSASEPFPLVDARRDGVETKADGSFTIAAASAGTWRLTATHGDHAPATSAPIAVDGIHDRTDIELALEDGAIIRGVVQDAAGKPVGAANVRVVVRGHTFWRAQRQAFTGTDGKFAIAGLPRRAVDIVASHASGASAIAPVDLAAAKTSDVTLKLDVTGAIAGTVVDAHGQPVGDAQVIAEPTSSDAPADRQAWTVRGVSELVTDQGGAFRFTGLPTGTYRVRAARPGASAAALELATSTSATVGGAPIKIVLSADGSIVGKVQLADGSVPLSFTVALGATPPTPFATKDGTFRIPAITGTHTLVVDGRRFLAAKAKDVTIKAGEPTDVGTIIVQPGRSVSGRVLDESGVPVAGAKVAAGALLTGGGAELYIPDESLGAKDAVTDANGQFVIEGFSPSAITVVAGKNGIGRSTSVRLPAGADSATINLVLQPTSGLDGTITRDGKPLADTIVIANPIGASSSNFFVATGADGTFALDALAPGPYVVYPMIGGGGPKPKDIYLRRVEVVAGARTKVSIDATPGPATLSVTVKTDAGALAPMAMVFAVQAKIAPTTTAELRDVDQLPVMGDAALPLYMRGAMGAPAEITGMRPGVHTICVGPPPKDPDAPGPIACQPYTVTAASKQTITVTVPAAWYAGK